jgi:hypothetical protein
MAVSCRGSQLLWPSSWVAAAASTTSRHSPRPGASYQLWSRPTGRTSGSIPQPAQYGRWVLQENSPDITALQAARGQMRVGPRSGPVPPIAGMDDVTHRLVRRRWSLRAFAKPAGAPDAPNRARSLRPGCSPAFLRGDIALHAMRSRIRGCPPQPGSRGAVPGVVPLPGGLPAVCAAAGCRVAGIRPASLAAASTPASLRDGGRGGAGHVTATA